MVFDSNLQGVAPLHSIMDRTVVTEKQAVVQ